MRSHVGTIRELTHVRCLHRHVPGRRTINIGLTPQCPSKLRVFNPISSHSHSFLKLRYYGCTAELSPVPGESPPSPKYPVSSPRYRKGECREDIPLTKSVRHNRKPRDPQMWSIGNPRAGTFSFLMALPISSSNQVPQLDATAEVGHASSC